MRLPSFPFRRATLLRWPAAVLALAAFAPVARPPAVDWTRFGFDMGRASAPTANMGFAAANITTLRRQQVTLDGTVDASAIYLHGVAVHGAPHDVFFVTTTYGKTVAIDAGDGTVLWEYTPPSYDAVAGSRQITTATPVADPDRRFIYAASPDGMIHKLSVADGRVIWSTSITRLPRREKIASALNYDRGHVIATTGGYIGDAPPYQGHVAILDAGTGRLEHIWNSLCSDRHELIDPASCKSSDSAIWGRAGAVVDSVTGDLFVATGNGPWNGTSDWGDAIVELDPGAATILGNYTPENTAELDADDADLGSTSPVVLGGGFVVQGGKDDLIRIIDWSKMRGTTPHKGGELQTVPTPSGTRLFTAPAVWHDGAAVWLFAADNGGTTAWRIENNRLQPVWHNATGGTSPIVVDGMLFVYDPGGGLHLYDAASGHGIGTLPCGSGHWNSPIAVDGRIALPEGNANDRRTSGVFDIWRLP